MDKRGRRVVHPEQFHAWCRRRTVLRLERDGLDLTGLEDLSGLCKIPEAWTAEFALEPARELIPWHHLRLGSHAQVRWSPASP
ncbi:MAG: hypothetical protein H5T68_04015 [Chloroflexi bacterium]|nr:hypothetical protein [Chloroflexota bacterium]